MGMNNIKIKGLDYIIELLINKHSNPVLGFFWKLDRKKPENILFFFGIWMFYRKNIYIMPSLLKTCFQSVDNRYYPIYLRSICIAENPYIHTDFTALINYQ